MTFKETCASDWADYRAVKNGIQKSVPVKKESLFDGVEHDYDIREDWADHYKRLKSWADRALSDLLNIEDWDCDLIDGSSYKDRLAQEVGERYRNFNYSDLKAILRIISESAAEAEPRHRAMIESGLKKSCGIRGWHADDGELWQSFGEYSREEAEDYAKKYTQDFGDEVIGVYDNDAHEVVAYYRRGVGFSSLDEARSS